MRRARRPADPFALLAALLLLVTAGCSGMSTPLDAMEKEEDEAAKVEYYRDAAMTYHEGGKYEAAARMWQRVLAVHPDDQWAKLGLAKALHMRGGVESLRQAEVLLVEILPRDWNHPTQGDTRHRVETSLANVYSDLADFYDRDARILEDRLKYSTGPEAATMLQQKQVQIVKRNELLAKSVPYYQAVLARTNDDPFALAGLAKANLVIGNDQEGIGYARRYVELSRSSQQGWRKKLQEWEKLVGRSVTEEQRAIYLRKIHGAREKEKGVLLLLGSVHMRREEFDQAADAYSAVLQVDRATPAAYVERAQARAALNQHGLAVEDLEQYLKLTDPVKQRDARAHAAELMDRYRRIAGMGSILTPTGTTAPAPTAPAAAASGVTPVPSMPMPTPYAPPSGEPHFVAPPPGIPGSPDGM
jgi:tetratricopeptide (TPR) repeat protein